MGGLLNRLDRVEELELLRLGDEMLGGPLVEVVGRVGEYLFVPVLEFVVKYTIAALLELIFIKVLEDLELLCVNEQAPRVGYFCSSRGRPWYVMIVRLFTLSAFRYSIGN